MGVVVAADTGAVMMAALAAEPEPVQHLAQHRRA
jgi:hypothetical protein